ncbi:MAG: hypothetical protein AAF662_11480 [Pseudomonadota bacterium]
MRSIAIITISFFLLAACTTVDSVIRVPIDVSASEFNSVYSQYYERPTWGSVVSTSDGGESLAITMDSYGDFMSVTYFDRPRLDEYRDVIAKFFE